MSNEQLKMKIDITQSTPILSEDGKPILLAEGAVLRKMSKFLAGTAEDALIPIPVMYNVSTNKILLDMIPKEIRDDYKDIGFTLGK
tara:strand:+ start:223 stop:480 length:258 start_codon:yes stop_codon:yes gene_type:complete